MATIHIADNVHPNRLARTETRTSGTDVHDGIYSMRAVTRATSADRQSRISSKEEKKARLDEKLEGLEEDEDPGLRRAEDFKERQTFTGTTLLWLSYQSIGVIYGDIGTSPLYVFSSTFKEAPRYDDLVGVLSILLWSLTLMVTVKYVLIILHADNDGEGGTFSTYSLLSRYLNITVRDPRETSLIQMKRWRSGDLESAGRQMRRGIEYSGFAKALLKILGVLGVSMVLSDGVLTPAQSVLGAVQGLEVVDSSISNGTIVGVTCAILILLFAIQPLGTSKIATTFAPIVIVWLGFNFSFGIYNLVKYDWTVLKAFNPGYGFQYLIRHGEDGWRSLGGILLAFTGVEALFADLGAFSRHAIQLSWLCYTYPCLLLAYIGQAAYISHNPEAYSNPFYNSVPPGTLYPSLVSAILAAIVASQAIITATFQLLAQVMKLSYFPQIKVVHTSTIFHGQLYVPMLNWLLMIGTVLVAAIYNNTTSLGNAYGVCVMFVTFFDTCMVSLAAMFVWRINPYYVVLPYLTIASLDGAYLSSALTKVPDGAWFTLTLSAIIASGFILWRFGKETQWAAEAQDRFPTSHFVKKNADGRLQITDQFGGGIVTTFKGLGIFFDKAGEMTPVVFSQFITKLVAVPEVMVFFHLRPLETPSVPPERRYTVSRLAIPNCYRLIIRHGYLDEVINPRLGDLIYEQIRAFIIARGEERQQVDSSLPHSTTTTSPSDPDNNNNADDDTNSNTTKNKTKTTDNNDSTAATRSSSSPSTSLSLLTTSYTHQTLFIIGKSTLKIDHPESHTSSSPNNNSDNNNRRRSYSWWKRVLLHIFLWTRENTRSKVATLKVPPERVFEVGFVREI